MLMPGDTAYIACYALTKGIMKGTVERVYHGIPHDVVQFRENRWTEFTLGKQCFATREEAVAAAEKARLARLAALKKQIERLEKLDVSKSVKELKRG